MASHIGAPSNRRNYHKLKGAFNFDKEFTNILSQYTNEVVEAIMEETQNVANDGCELLKQTLQPSTSESGSAKPMSRRQWKKYANSWQVQVNGGEGSNFIRCVVHNKKHYRLTHLLEYGHATRNGLRTRAFRHIEPIEKYCTERIEKNIPKIIEKGGKL